MKIHASANRKGFFIVLEGGEGSGKSIHAAAVADFLRRHNHQVLLTHEPGATPLGATLRDVILVHGNAGRTLDPKTELFLFLADRAQHVAEIIRPALVRGDIVICDRFVASTMAYQGAGRQLDDAMLIAMNMFATDSLVPDLVIYLDVEPLVGLARKKGQHDHTMNRLDAEQHAFHERVRQKFRHLAATDPTWVTVDAHRDIAVVEGEIRSCIMQAIT